MQSPCLPVAFAALYLAKSAEFRRLRATLGGVCGRLERAFANSSEMEEEDEERLRLAGRGLPLRLPLRVVRLMVPREGEIRVRERRPGDTRVARISPAGVRDTEILVGDGERRAGERRAGERRRIGDFFAGDFFFSGDFLFAGDFLGDFLGETERRLVDIFTGDQRKYW